MSFDKEKWSAILLLQDAVHYHRDNGDVDTALVINALLMRAVKLDGGPGWLLDGLNKTRAELWGMV